MLFYHLKYKHSKRKTYNYIIIRKSLILYCDILSETLGHSSPLKIVLDTEYQMKCLTVTLNSILLEMYIRNNTMVCCVKWSHTRVFVHELNLYNILACMLKYSVLKRCTFIGSVCKTESRIILFYLRCIGNANCPIPYA